MTCCSGTQQLCKLYATIADLQNDDDWFWYFDMVYGVESMHFPFSMAPLNFFYTHLLSQSVREGLRVRGQEITTVGFDLRPSDGAGPLCLGDLYRLWGGDAPPDLAALDIWRCIYPVGQPTNADASNNINFQLATGFPSNAWVEVMHSRGDPAQSGMWFYYAAGSGIYFNVGASVVFPDHGDASSAWGLGQSDDIVHLVQEAVRRGYDTIQFTHRKEGIFKYEIVATRIQSPQSDGCFPQAFQTLFRAGYGGVRPCACQEGLLQINCRGDVAASAFRKDGTLPTFQTMEELQASAFATYLRLVYGAETNFSPGDFPMRFSDFDVLWLSSLQRCGLQPGGLITDRGSCDLKELQLYVNMSNDHDPPGTIWVWKTKPLNGVASNTWVEVTHCVQPGEGVGMWCYVAKGSGVFANAGNTRSFDDHPDAIKAILGETCGDTECGPQFDKLFTFARDHDGLDTVQFTRHADMRCGNRAVEIVLLRESGRLACGRPGPAFARGWNHSLPCVCNTTQPCLNCGGLTPAPTTLSPPPAWTLADNFLGVGLVVIGIVILLLLARIALRSMSCTRFPSVCARWSSP